MDATLSPREYDEIRAPRDLPAVGVKAGDRGVVVETFYDHPAPAVMVEHADGEGQTKALVIYAPDLRNVYDVVPMLD